MSIKCLRRLSCSQRVAVVSELALSAALALYLVAVGATVASGGSVDALEVLVIVLLFSVSLLNLNWQRSEERCRSLGSPVPEGMWWPVWDDGEPVDVRTPFTYKGSEVTGLFFEGNKWYLIGPAETVCEIASGQRLQRSESNTPHQRASSEPR